LPNLNAWQLSAKMAWRDLGAAKTKFLFAVLARQSLRGTAEAAHSRGSPQTDKRGNGPPRGLDSNVNLSERKN